MLDVYKRQLTMVESSAFPMCIAAVVFQVILRTHRETQPTYEKVSLVEGYFNLQNNLIPPH